MSVLPWEKAVYQELAHTSHTRDTAMGDEIHQTDLHLAEAQQQLFSAKPHPSFCHAVDSAASQMTSEYSF